MELLLNQQNDLENSSISLVEDENHPKSPNVHENENLKAVVDLHTLKQLLDRFELAEKELKRLIDEFTFPNIINKFEKFIISEMINPETTNEQIIEMRKIYHELKNNNQDHSKILENLCDPSVLDFSMMESVSTQNEKQSDVDDNINNPKNKSCERRRKSEKLKIKNSSTNNRRRTIKKNHPGLIKIYPKSKKGCYETEKFDSKENIWNHSPSSSVIHCELMTSNNNEALSFNSPNLQVTTSAIESFPQTFMNIGFSSENNYFLDTSYQNYVQQLLVSDDSTIDISHYEDTLLYYTM
ncbi:10984_t:CDS:1 [Gigaspora margarita]|uniref:10984_t:CDS:1 n=1 Tax=Gigaspora margarita TaxID=4874 RepID=A0ABN7UL26_GIGMA|nr:10984_t:CDS:1 [Gigaspora margarita]